MKLKLDEQGHAVVVDGKPIYTHDDGKEVPFDAPATINTIARLNYEAQKHRELKEAHEARLKAFEGIEDAETARKALETMRNVDEGKLVAAGKVEEIKAAARKAAEEQVAAAAKSAAEQLKQLEAQGEKLRQELYAEKVGGSFERSKFVKEKVAIPPDILQSRFGDRFKVEDGRTVAYDAAGNKIFSRAKPGELAEFDEAIEVIIDSYPYRDQIIRGTGLTGTGARPGNGSASGAGRTMTRAEFDTLPIEKQPGVIRAKTAIVD